MGAVGAIAPMVYDGVGASTHGFRQILSQINQFHKKDVQTISNIVIPLQNLKSSTHSLKILTRAL